MYPRGVPGYDRDVGIIRRAVDWLTLANVPAVTFSEETAPRPIDAVIYEMSRATGRVTRDEALSVPAVQQGRRLICSIATLPLVQLGPDRDIVRHALFEQIDPSVPNIVVVAQTVEDLLFEGISWWRVIDRGFDGFPTAARHLDVGSVSINPPGGRAPSPLPGGHDPRGAVLYVDGERVAATELIRFDSPNPALLKVGGRAIRRALLLDQAAGMYADDPRPADFFTPADGVDPVDDDAVRDLLDLWKAARKQRSTAYVPAALKYNAIDIPSPVELQLAELQKQASLDIANCLGVDPEDLGVSTTSRTYANAVDRRRDRINDVLAGYMRAVTDRLSMGDVTKRGYRANFDLDDYLRADPKTRFEVYQAALTMGVLTVEEIRKEENLPPLPASARPRPVTALPTNGRPAIAASLPASATFDADPTPASFTADVPCGQFTVDGERRTIAGLALPYNRVAAKGGQRFRFAAGSLRWQDVKRVKLLRDHDYSQAVGHAVELTETPEGLVTKFKVARGPEGDRVLSLAEDGVLDGFSVGVDFTDLDRDPDHQGVHLVRTADLREVSLTAMPAFDDARVTSLAASRDQGDNMPDEPVTAPVAPALPDLSAMFAAWAAQNQPTPAPAPERPTFVDPIRPTVGTFVNEPTPYTFDRRGNIRRGTHDFSTDLFAGSRGDIAALERAQTFMRAQFDVDRADVAALNPSRQRPDMYVDQREYRYPVWESINKGTIADQTPFIFPKFNTASGLVAAHTEGVEPTPGAYTNTTQTVTPTPVSGKIEITREAWDQGGNPQMSNLIWRQMVRAYYEALEASAVAVLDAATPTAIALTAGGGTTGQTLDAEITAAFAALQFIRGGFSMDTMFTQVDLYKALIAAQDGDKRRLYPAVGPANATGTVRSRFAAIDVNGVLALPAWALAATGSVVASSYLFDSEVVHGWATAPEQLKFEYRVAYIELAIWGYKATAISDVTGVREITYDPVA